ncbi:hypothetical protein B0H14DRAFT_3485116 [Mycena olivaceomarginata]|nr:hypothetical protein B0H14DRAFT_3485116 [Mycena olivaceomarginata]
MQAEERRMRVLGCLLEMDELQREKHTNSTVLARFSHPSAGRTIRWTLEMQAMACGCWIPAQMQEATQDLAQPAPEAGDKVNEAKKCKHEVDEDGNPERECYDDDDYDDGPEPVAPRVSVAKSLPPPHLTLPAAYRQRNRSVRSLEGPLQSPDIRIRPQRSRFVLPRKRREVKKRAPGAIYPDILSETYNDVALRLGMEPTRADAASFAQSITDWPLVPDAAWCLATLHTIPGLSIAAIADADRESLGRMPAFTAPAPYFDTVSWDACTAYKPDRAVFEKPVQYHDALESSVFPGVWICYHRNLAENVHIRQGAHPALIGTNLADLAAMFVAAKVPN